MVAKSIQIYDQFYGFNLKVSGSTARSITEI